MNIFETYGQEFVLFVVCLGFLTLAFVPALRLLRRPLLLAAGIMLLTIILVAMRNQVFQDTAALSSASHVLEVTAVICWWIVAGVLASAAFHHVVRRWIFPNRDQPRARKLFADLSAALIYVVVGAGILNAIAGPSLYGMLATSGVAAVVLGLALQSTLADVFSNLALNLERPFRAGEWIALQEGLEGRLLEINWRAARLLTAAGDLIVIPNSYLAKAVVRNRSRPNPYTLVSLQVTLPQKLTPERAIAILLAAPTEVSGVLNLPGPSATMVAMSDASILYELDFYVKDYELIASARGAVLQRVWHNTADHGVGPPGAPTVNAEVSGSEARPGTTAQRSR